MFRIVPPRVEVKLSKDIQVIGRKLRFSLAIKLNAIPSFNSNRADLLLTYLHLSNPDYFLVPSFLRILIENRLIVHKEKIDSEHNVVFS